MESRAKWKGYNLENNRRWKEKRGAGIGIWVDLRRKFTVSVPVSMRRGLGKEEQKKG